METTYRDSLRIVIIGGGLGGLAAALALQNEGFNVNVYERDVQFTDRKQGYGLTLTNNPKGPLAKLGVLEEVLSKDCCSNQHWVFRPSGHVCGYYGRALKSNKLNIHSDQLEQTEAKHEGDRNNFRGNIRIPRQELRRILLQRLAPGTVKWGRRLVSYKDTIESVTLEFECTVATSSNPTHQNQSDEPQQKEVVVADVVVGADGIHSKIRQSRDLQNADLGPPPLQYTGVSVIIGLSTAKHPLLSRGGFYVLDGCHRLFVMPFQDEITCSCENYSESGSTRRSPPHRSSPCSVCGRGQPQLTMWQLSFSCPEFDSGLNLHSMCRDDLLKEALRRTDGWMDPVQDLVRLTLSEEAAVWGTKLYDRDPMVLRPKHKQQMNKRKRASDDEPIKSDDHGGGLGSISVDQNGINTYTSSSRITVLGDACHPMSMFKGQGCNQAMEDGPLLASWLGRPGLTADNLFTRLRCFEREMIARTTPKVSASREAAHLYHSPEALEIEFGFEGLTSAQSLSLMAALEEANITAALGDQMQLRIVALAEKIKSTVIESKSLMLINKIK